MLSMTLATLGWACWWFALLLAKVAGVEPNVAWVEVCAAVFAIPGLAVAIFTLRAQASWLFFVSVPLMANAGLLLLPLVLPEDFFVHAG